MRTLVIDSHKGSNSESPQNLHWLNACAIADHLGADLIWSYPHVNDKIAGGYDAIVFNHASHYSYTDYAWLEKNPDARLFYLTNEYNLGEPRTLWTAAKAGRKYTVIANHPAKISKVVKKYVSDWIVLNLNAVSFAPRQQSQEPRRDCIYWGNFRADRVESFRKYIGDSVVLSTSPKNMGKFIGAGVNPYRSVGRVNWANGALSGYATSLYIEDEITHDNYNFLANRFYESVAFGCVPIFDAACENTIRLSGYPIGAEYMASSAADVAAITHSVEGGAITIPAEWTKQATEERAQMLAQIASIVGR